MKYILLFTFFLIFCSFNSNAQERTNRQTAKISDNVESSLQKATGWMYNDDGQWVSFPNMILSRSFKPGEKPGRNYGSTGTDNFSFYQFRKISYLGIDYPVFIKESRYGFFKNKISKTDWTENPAYDIWVIEKNEIEKLQNLIEGEINLIKLKVIYKHRGFISLSKVLNDLEQEYKPEEKEYELIFHVAPYKGKNIVQFNIYEVRPVSSFSKIKTCTPSFDYYDKDFKNIRINLTDELFKKCYYETDYNNFSQLIK